MNYNYVNTMFKNIDSSWFKIFNEDINILCSILARIKQDLPVNLNDVNIEKYISPHPNNIFKPFMYFPVKQLKIVLIGHEPYSEYKKSNGLCFSHSKDFIPKYNDSIKSIIDCIKKTCNIDITHNDIKNWTSNNMLMINTYLTKYSNVMITKGLVDKSKFWETFTINLLKSISSYNQYENNEIYFLPKEWRSHQNR